ncbi:MAG: RNA 2',3'-cyclic phosphodiesterase [Candidatus Omnitrophota bacterium]
MTIRCFIALTISKDTQKELGLIQENLKRTGAKARWVKPENIHITLRFLGDQDLKRVKQITEAFPLMFDQPSGFGLIINSVSVFPNKQKPRIVWASISEGEAETKSLFEHMNNGLAKLGLPKDREEFIPHLTLARCKTSDESRSIIHALEKIQTVFIETRPTAIVFCKSTLSAHGSIYEEMASVRL